jgi:hypothetical protein
MIMIKKTITVKDEAGNELNIEVNKGHFRGRDTVWVCYEDIVSQDTKDFVMETYKKEIWE